MNKKTPSTRRSVRVCVHLTRIEHRQLRRAAAEVGDTASTYARRAILLSIREWLKDHPDQCSPDSGQDRVLAG
jgi:hypothetical protein